MRGIKALGALALASLSTIILTAVVVAYPSQVAGQVVVSGPDFIIACGYDWTIKAHVTESGTGNPIEGQPVHFELVSTTDPNDTLSPADTTTNSNGNAFTTLHVTTTVGQRTISAQADDVTGQFTVDCEEGGLPPTSVASDLGTTQGSGFNWALLAAVGAVIAGFGIVGLRFVRR